jgi:hypothetical protein
VKEIKLVGPGAGIIGLGKRVRDHLQEHSIPCSYALHYSAEAVPHRKSFMLKRQAAFEAFKTNLHVEDVRAEATRVLDESGVAPRWKEKTLQGFRLTDSLRWLAFYYPVQFEEIARGARPAAVET